MPNTPFPLPHCTVQFLPTNNLFDILNISSSMQECCLFIPTSPSCPAVIVDSRRCAYISLFSPSIKRSVCNTYIDSTFSKLSQIYVKRQSISAVRVNRQKPNERILTQNILEVTIHTLREN